jgi:hypothetical protein
MGCVNEGNEVDMVAAVVGVWRDDLAYQTEGMRYGVLRGVVVK